MRIRVPLFAGSVTIAGCPARLSILWRMTPSAEYADALVIFGISGDLAFKKIFPALENLERRGRLPPTVVGVARGTTRDSLIDRARDSLAQHDPTTDSEALRRLERNS